MKATIFFPAETWAVYLRKVAEKQTKEFPVFLKDELRRWLEMIVTLTPPDTTDQGAKAVKRDIGLLVRPLESGTFDSPRVKALLDRNDVAGFQAFARNVPSLANAKIIRAEDVPELHRASRDNRGRVRRSSFAGNYVLGFDQVRTLGNYIARKVSHVGMAIAGWTPALHFLGGAVTKSVSILDVPEHGSFRSTLEDSLKPSIDAINSSPWASRHDEGQRIIANARNARIGALMTRLKALTGQIMKESGSHKHAA